MTIRLDESLVSRIGHLPPRGRAVLLAAYATAPSTGPAGCCRCETSRRRLAWATGLSGSTIGRALRDIRRSHTPGITVTRRASQDGGDEGITIDIQEA